MPPESTGGIESLLDGNRRWAARMHRERPGFFRSLVAQQAPRYMWIGCSDSRVPANQITGLVPGEVFVHRNVGNVVGAADLNALSAIEFAVRVLRVRHLLVVGHHGCGAVEAAMQDRPLQLGVAEAWIRQIQQVHERYSDALALLPAEHRQAALVELNVLEQAVSVCRTSAVRDAWRAGQHVSVHALSYRLDDGLLRPLAFAVDEPGLLWQARARALAELTRRYGGCAVEGKP